MESDVHPVRKSHTSQAKKECKVLQSTVSGIVSPHVKTTHLRDREARKWEAPHGNGRLPSRLYLGIIQIDAINHK